ncbi:hypothetical protein HGB07_06400 [Candidatus Roizmanbacteria bacterium]|nr:hypothetical protein [Candidatus Roizmanbacteria bacterium]
MQYSIINFDITREESDFRLDAEYYHPKYIHLEKDINSLNSNYFGTLVDEIRCGPFGSTVLCDSYMADGVVVARPFNLVNCSLERENLVYIPETEANAKKLKFYQEGDIFFSRVGDVRCGIVPKFSQKVTISPNIIAVKVNKKKINPYYSTIFFNTKYGLPQIERGLKVVAQPTIQTDLISKIRIVLLSSQFQQKIETIFVHSLKLNDQCKEKYKEAENILLSELNLLGWKPKHTLSFIKKFSETQTTHRIDADYFQPAYEEIIHAIRHCKNGYKKLNEIVSIKKSVEPGSSVYRESGVPFVRISNLSMYGITTDNQQYISEDLYKDLIKYQPNIGEILLSKDGTPGIALHLKEEPKKMIPSGGILRLSVKDTSILPEYLTLVLNSILAQQQILRDVGGSIIIHWLTDHIENTLVPVLDEKIQRNITDIVNSSFQARNQSKALLEIAKEGVEMAIEKNELEAIDWIKNQVAELGLALED